MNAICVCCHGNIEGIEDSDQAEICLTCYMETVIPAVFTDEYERSLIDEAGYRAVVWDDPRPGTV